MKRGKTIALLAAGLVAGLAVGSLGIASAATATPTAPGPVAAVTGACLGIGNTVREAGGRLIDIVARLTGLSADDVRAQRRDGASLADIAESEGVGSDELVDEALKTRKSILDEQVKGGTITAEDETAILDRMRERLESRIGAAGGPGFGGGRGMGGGAGPGNGPGACGGCTETQ